MSLLTLVGESQAVAELNQFNVCFCWLCKKCFHVLPPVGALPEQGCLTELKHVLAAAECEGI